MKLNARTITELNASKDQLKLNLNAFTIKIKLFFLLFVNCSHFFASQRFFAWVLIAEFYLKWTFSARNSISFESYLVFSFKRDATSTQNNRSWISSSAEQQLTKLPRQTSFRISRFSLPVDEEEGWEQDPAKEKPFFCYFIEWAFYETRISIIV